MKKRVISAIILVGIALPIIMVGGNIFAIASAVLAMLAYKEIGGLSKDGYPKVLRLLGLLGLFALVFNNYNATLSFAFDYSVLTFLLLLLLLPLLFYKQENYDAEKAMTLLGFILFLGVGFNALIIIRSYSLSLLFDLILITALTDTFAWLFGLLIGRHPLTSISPKKTWEGAICGTLMATFVSTVFITNVIALDLMPAIFISLILSIVGQCGDLIFSAIKRHYGIKDYSNLIPGHGGVLDRFDSIILVVIVMALIMNFI